MTEDDIVAIEAQLIAMPLANRGHEERELIMNKVPALTAALRAAWEENARLEAALESEKLVSYDGEIGWGDIG